MALSTTPAPSRLPERTAAPPTAPSWWAVTGPGLAVGAVAALVGLDRASLWRDEAYSLGAVHQLGPTLRETRGTMGLYYVLLRGWATVSDAAWWLRLLSVLLALAALVAVVHLARRLLGPAAARLAGLFLGLSVLWVAYAQEARAYTLVLLLGATAWVALDHALAADDDRHRRRWWALHTALCLVLPLAHGLAVLQVLAHPVALALGGADRSAWRRALPGVVGCLAVTGCLVALGTSEAGTWIAPLDAVQLRVGLESATSAVLPFTLTLTALLAVGAGLAVRRLRLLPPGPERIRAALPLAWALVPPALLAAVSLARPTFVPRYAMASAAGVALLLAAAARALDGRRPGRPPLIALAVVAVLAVGQVDLHASAGDDWRTAAATVAGRARAGDALLLAESEVRPPFEAAWAEGDDRPPLDVVNGPRALGEVRRVDRHLTDADAIEQARSRDRLWLVGETRAASRRRALDVLTASSHALDGTWEEDGVTVHLLVAR